VGLINTLSQATTGLAAAEYGLNVTGQNIANLNTEGYARRTVGLAEIPPSSGGGVTVTGARAMRDAFLEARIRQQFPAEEQQGAVASSLAVVETSLGTPGQSIDARLSAFFNSFATLAQDPTSSVSRDSVVVQGQQVATAFNAMAGSLADARVAADAQIRSGVVQINALASQIAALNTSIGKAAGGDAETLRDQLGIAVKALSGLADVTVLQRADGGADVSIGIGRALVIGDQTYAVGIGSAGLSGLATVTSGGVDITAEMKRGQLGGLLQVRDTLVPGYQDKLDQLALGVAQQVNGLHKSGFDANGNPGLDFFTAPATAPGAAAALAVNTAIAGTSTVAGDSSLVAASKTGSSGDNGTAKAIAGLADARVMAGNTASMTDVWSQLVYRVASDSQTAQAQQVSGQQIVDQITKLRDQVSGVSLDEEAASMLKYQRAYQANAKLFMSADAMLTTLMGMVGVT
jgi:flagellar hook-associated protein 1 FlgK